MNIVPKPAPQAAYVARTHAQCAKIGLGKVNMAILLDHVDFIVGGAVMLFCDSPPWQANSFIVSVRHCGVSDLTDQEVAATDWGGRKQIIMARGFYGQTRDVTVIRWGQPGGYFVRHADVYAFDPESVYESISCV